MRAAVRGVIDFSEARLHDPLWWMRARILIAEMHRQDEQRLEELLMSAQAAYLAQPRLDDKSFDAAKKNMATSLDVLWNMARPWEKQQAKHKGADLAELYRKYIGDYRDPAFRKQVDDDIKRMKAEMASVAIELTNDDKIAAKLRERDRRQSTRRRW